MNKYFLLGFALLLLGLNIGLRTGNWFAPQKVKVVRVRAKAPKPIVKVVKVEVPAAPVACIKRAVSSVAKPHKVRPISKLPAPVVPPAPAEPTIASGVISVDRRAPADLVDQTLKVESDTAGSSLIAPVIKSIQTEE